MSAWKGRLLSGTLLCSLFAGIAAGAGAAWAAAPSPAALPSAAAGAEAAGNAAMGAAIREEKVAGFIAPLRYVFDGEVKSPAAGEEGLIIFGRTYVPLRFMANAVNKRVHWAGTASTVYVFDPPSGEEIGVPEPASNAAAEAAGQAEEKAPAEPVFKMLTVHWRAVTYVFDGVRIGPEDAAPGLFYNHRLYVPLRFFGESLGKQVDWDGTSYTITVTSKPRETGGGEAGAGEGSGETVPPATPPVPGGISGGGPGAGTQKPSYESLLADAETRLMHLQNRCEQELTPLAEEFFRTYDFRLIEQGEQVLASCDAEFDKIIGELEADLLRYGYDPEIVAGFRKAYEQLKSEKMNELLKRYMESS